MSNSSVADCSFSSEELNQQLQRLAEFFALEDSKYQSMDSRSSVSRSSGESSGVEFQLVISSPEMVEMELNEEWVRMEMEQEAREEKLRRRRGIVCFEKVAEMADQREKETCYSLGIFVESNYF